MAAIIGTAVFVEAPAFGKIEDVHTRFVPVYILADVEFVFHDASLKDPCGIAGAWVYCIAVYTLAIRTNPNKHLGQTLT